MKPRPSISTIAIFSRSAHAPCRRTLHTRPALSCHLWHDRSRPNARHNSAADRTAYLRYASTSAARAHEAHHSRDAKPSTPAPKSHKTNVPAKSSTTTSSPHTTTVPAKRTPSHPQVPILKVKESLNPPSFTYAPDLTVPPRGRDQNFFSYLWKCGRSYLSFYKSGVSNVRQTSKLAKALRAKTTALNRAEWQIVQRSRRDILRLPAFGVIFLVFGEWTPLLVMYITPLIPEPCRIPSQVERALGKVERRRRERKDIPLRHIERLRKAGAGRNPAVVASSAALRHFNAKEATHLDLLVSSARYDAHARVWDWIQMIPPRALLLRNLEKKFRYLRKDDEMISRDGGWQGLEKREVERACVERGIDVLGKKEGDLRRALQGWFEGK